MENAEIMHDNAHKSWTLSFRGMAILASVAILFHLVLAIFVEEPSMRVMLDDILFPIVNIAAALCLVYAARSSKKFGWRAYVSWSVLALAQLSFALGDAAWAVIEVGFNESPFPSVADVPYIAFYILFFVGIVLLPAAPFAKGEMLKVVLDTGIVMIASILVFWTLLISPTIASASGEDAVTQTLTVAYPVLDMLLLFVVFELLFRRYSLPGRGPLLLLASGAATLIISDTIFMSQSLNDTYIPGGLLDTGWLFSYAFIGLAGIMQAKLSQAATSFPDVEQRHILAIWPLYLPYLCAGASYVLLVYSQSNPLPIPFSNLALYVGVVVGLVIVRQVVALKENVNLYRETLQEISERKRAEEEVRRLNEALEARVADRTARLEAANVDLQKEIIERKRAEEKIASSLREKEVLLREIYHRVKNNLQVISSLLRLQSNRIEDNASREIFKESQNRIRSMALVHEKLCRSSNLAEIDLRDYVSNLTMYLLRSYDESSKIRLSIDVDEIPLGIDAAVPCGLIINELLSNSLKYAFPDGNQGEIYIGLKLSVDGDFSLTVSDDGIGLPDDFEVEKCKTLGLQLVNALVKQLHGAMEVDGREGAKFRIRFKDVVKDMAHKDKDKDKDKENCSIAEVHNA